MDATKHSLLTCQTISYYINIISIYSTLTYVSLYYFDIIIKSIIIELYVLYYKHLSQHSWFTFSHSPFVIIMHHLSIYTVDGWSNQM